MGKIGHVIGRRFRLLSKAWSRAGGVALYVVRGCGLRGHDWSPWYATGTGGRPARQALICPSRWGRACGRCHRVQWTTDPDTAAVRGLPVVEVTR
jgi:hypothetical protein